MPAVADDGGMEEYVRRRHAGRAVAVFTETRHPVKQRPVAIRLPGLASFTDRLYGLNGRAVHLYADTPLRKYPPALY